MSADSPRRSWSSGSGTRGLAVPAMVPPQVVSDRSILDSAIGFINDVTLAHQPHTDPKDTITWARFETGADISDPCFGDDWELEGNMTPPLLLVLGYGLGVQVWAIPANGEAVEVLSWRHGVVSTLRVLPTPSSVFTSSDNMRADDVVDVYADKRPLIGLVDGNSTSGAQPQFSSVNIISLKFGTQVKTIKFKNPVIDILANRFAIVITFHERIAVFDSRTLEDRLSVTTCYPSPGINPNPIALGTRWLAYAEHKLIHAKRSSGGCDGESVASYTATVLNAAKSLGRGLKELGEQVAAGLTGNPATASLSKNNSFDSATGSDAKQPGVVTIIDIKNPIRDCNSTNGLAMSGNQAIGNDPVIVHFVAHSEALVAMEFDYSGMLLITADRRGHDFHVFRIQPQPVGSSLAAVHHLYVLHRGDTSAKVQNISFSLDSRWVAISTLRGTTHVFPITPYGGPIGVRTHTSLHVVNKLSRFHRSAGLSADGRSNSPISHSESTTFTQSLQPYHNPTLPPFPRPTIILPLAQLRQPSALSSPPGSAALTGVNKSIGSGGGTIPQRQRLSSLSDDNGKPLSVCAVFAKSRSWLLEPPNATRDAPHRMQHKPVDSLFVMAGHGALIQYDLDTKLASNVAKEKICHDTPIELIVEAKAQWDLGRRKEGTQEIMPPLMSDNWLLRERNTYKLTDSMRQYYDTDDRSDSWLAQVEIVTHAGPHRRLWMGPQFVFKTYNSPSGSNLNHVDAEAIEIGISKTASKNSAAERSSPLNMPLISGNRSGAVPVLIESGSYSSIEHSPKLMDRFRHDHLNSDYSISYGDTQLKEDLADAMRESPSVSTNQRNDGRNSAVEAVGTITTDNPTFYDAIGNYDEIDSRPSVDDHHLICLRKATVAALANALPNIHSYDEVRIANTTDILRDKNKNSIEKIVNPLGTVTTVTTCLTTDLKADILDEVVSQLAAEDAVIHENCDESLFRPVVTIFCDEKLQAEAAARTEEFCKPPELISNKLIVPVIAKEVDEAINKKEKHKLSTKKQKLLAKESHRRSTVNKVEAVIGCTKANSEYRKETILKKTKDDNNYSSLEKCCDLITSNKNNTAGQTKNIQIQESAGSHYENDYITKTNGKTGNEITTQTKFAKKHVEKTTPYISGKESSCKTQATTSEVEVKSNESESTAIKVSKRSNQTNKCEPSIRTMYTLEPPISSNLSATLADATEGEQLSTGTITLDKQTEMKDFNGKDQKLKILPKNGNSNKNKNFDVGQESRPACIDEAEANTIYPEIQVKAGRRNKKRIQKSSASNSENDDVVEVPSISLKKRREKNSIDAKVSAQSIINANTENAVSCKSKKVEEELEGPMLLSFLKMKERKNHKFESQEQQYKRNSLTTQACEIKQEEHLLKFRQEENILPSKCQESKLAASNENISTLEACEERETELQKSVSSSQLKKVQNKHLKYQNFNKIHGDVDTTTSDIHTKISSDNNNRNNDVRTTNVNDKATNSDQKEQLPVEDSLPLSSKGEYNTNNENDTITYPTLGKGENSKRMPEVENSCVEIEISEKKENRHVEPAVEEPSAARKAVEPSTLLDVSTGDKHIGSYKALTLDKSYDSNTAELNAEKLADSIEINTIEDSNSESAIKFPENPANCFTLGAATTSHSAIFEELEAKSSIIQKDANTSSLTSNDMDPLLPLKLPALSPLQPLDLIINSIQISAIAKDFSLINFESPLKENQVQIIEPKVTTAATTAAKDSSEQNVLYTLSSLHYENELLNTANEKPDISSAYSSAHSFSVLEDRSFIENEDPYLSFEQSSQDMTKASVLLTIAQSKDKIFGSSNSSGSEDLITVEDAKFTKKQKLKKKQQQQKQKQRPRFQLEIDDEELRPLIAMTESQNEYMPALKTEPNTNETEKVTNANFSTTDSEELMPTTTSDDNAFPITISTGNKIKTKKLEHKINLIAAIEAATSSSTSSAEESSVELNTNSTSHHHEDALITINSLSSTGVAGTILPLAATVNPNTQLQTASGMTKKKSKRRKR